VAVDSVNPAIPDQSHEVQRPTGFPDVSADVRERRDPKEGPIPNREVDPHDVLHDHATGAQVQVADLAVSHLAFGQSNG
jgi:hypothetical protein